LLTIMRFDLSWLKSNGGSKNDDFAGRLETMGTCLTQAIASVKRISKELRPPQLDELGIVGAIQLDVSQVESKVGLTTHLVIDPPEFYLNKQLSMTLYRVFNEILTNVVRHAGAKNVAISLVKTSQDVVIEVEDDGRGIRKDELKGTMSLGLIGMRERVRQWGGHLAITGREGKGTSVTAQFPLQKKRNGRSVL
jgi:signal transduction histidine kinase